MTSDEGLHEIQLNGKQLVFLFMAGTVVFVVIFLCGVLVGRGVRGRVQLTEVAAAAAADPTAPETVAPASAGTPPPASTSGSTAPAAPETLTYPDRLEDDNAPPETLGEPIDPTASARRSRTPPPPAIEKTVDKPAERTVGKAGEKAGEKTVAKSVDKPAETRATAAQTTRADAAAEPAGNGFVVQVAAVRERAEADTIARRLSSKGYPTFVTTSGGAAAPRVFRVRVGKYPDRRAAETIKTRLEKEEQFKPWVTK